MRRHPAHPPVHPPLTPTNRATSITHARRIALIGRVLTGDDTPLCSRVAAGLLPLYAQPVSRIVRLPIDDVDQVLLRLGDPPPAPFATLVLAYISRAGRAAAFRQHVSQMPAPVVAKALGTTKSAPPKPRRGRNELEPLRPRRPKSSFPRRTRHS